MKKIEGTTKTQRGAVRELLRARGAVIASRWTNGAGRYTTTRPIPPFAERISRYEYAKQPRRIQKVVDDHPRARFVVAITDMRGARRVIAREDGGAIQ